MILAAASASRVLALGAFCFAVAATPAEPSAASKRPDLLLVTLDTTRADELEVAGGGARTPNLNRLAAAGARFVRALSPAPLTLPAHASLLTGLDPNEHGLRDNGGGALPSAATTIAEELSRAGYVTVAVVGSRVLDRRFGLNRGFDIYDDRMAAERTGEFGYAERPASEVVDAALAAVTAATAVTGVTAATAATAATGTLPERPLFLWVHFYDPHAPYRGAGASERERYRGEIAEVDRQIGRLLADLRPDRQRWVIAVGDHGESFGEHGEQEHGFLLHEPTLAVPLIVQGPGAAAGTVIRAPVSIRDVAATLAGLGGLRRTRLAGRALGLRGEPEPGPIYHETDFPASTFGWSPLAAVTRGRWRFVDGPNPALFDLEPDPGESVNRAGERTEIVRELRRELRSLQSRKAMVPDAAPKDAELARALASLGYLSGASGRRGTIDPAAGLAMLAELAEVNQLVSAGDLAVALARLRDLVRRSPYSVPFLARLAYAEQLAGDFGAARAALVAALSVNSENEFLHTSLGELEREAGRPAAAETAFRNAVRSNPRHAPAWLGLGEILARSGRGGEEEQKLREAVAAQCESGAIHARLAQIALARGDLPAAELDGRRATELLPAWAPAWRLWGEAASRAGNRGAANERFARALSLGG